MQGEFEDFVRLVFEGESLASDVNDGNRAFRRLVETATIRFFNGEAIFSGNAPPSEVQVQTTATTVLADTNAIQAAINVNTVGNNITVDYIIVDDSRSLGSFATTRARWWAPSLLGIVCGAASTL